MSWKFSDLFRGFFGLNHNSTGFDDFDLDREGFRNPIWQTDEDDDDIDGFRFSIPDMHFHIFGDPSQTKSIFDQMDNMFKDFMFRPDEMFDKTMESIKHKDDLRESMLKSDNESSIMKREQKVDTDLDGKVGREEILKMWNKENVETAKPPASYNFAKRCVSKQTIIRPDGSVQHKNVIQDSEGNMQTIISKEINDKKYVVTTKKDKNGVETKSEDFFNMDESELKDFNQQWAAKDNTNEKLLHDKLLHAKLMYEKFNANDFLSHPPMEGFPRVSIWKGFF